MEIKVYKKEKFYFWLMLFISIAIYITVAIFVDSLISVVPSVLCYILLLLLLKLYFIGHIRGSAIKITPEQFPDIYAVLERQTKLLELSGVPNMYLQQSGGVLNAFATRFARTNYVVLYSSILEAAYQEGMHAVEFIIGHELGHIKRKHVYSIKSFLIAPARFVPFLSAAYSRACEYTCDRIGYTLCPQGAVPGMIILLSGSSLYKKVDVSQLLRNAESERGFLTWFVEIFSSHPLSYKRIKALQNNEN